MTDRPPLDGLSINALNDHTLPEDPVVVLRSLREKQESTSEPTARNDASEDGNRQENKNLTLGKPKSSHQILNLSDNTAASARGDSADPVPATRPFLSATQTSLQASARSTSPRASDVTSRNKRRLSHDETGAYNDPESSQRPQNRRRIGSSTSSIEFPRLSADAPPPNSDNDKHTDITLPTRLADALASGRRRRLSTVFPCPTPIAQDLAARRAETTDSTTSVGSVDTPQSGSDEDTKASNLFDDAANSQTPGLAESPVPDTRVASAASTPKSSTSLAVQREATTSHATSTRRVRITPEIVDELAGRYYELVCRPRTSSGSNSNTPTPVPTQLIIGDGLHCFHAQEPLRRTRVGPKQQNFLRSTQSNSSLPKQVLRRTVAGTSDSTPIAGSGATAGTAQTIDQPLPLTQSQSFSTGHIPINVQLDSHPQLQVSDTNEQASARILNVSSSHHEQSTQGLVAQPSLALNILLGSTSPGLYLDSNVPMDVDGQSDENSAPTPGSREVIHTQGSFEYADPGVYDSLSLQHDTTLQANNAAPLVEQNITNTQAQTDLGQNLLSTNSPGYVLPTDLDLDPAIDTFDDFASPFTLNDPRPQYSQLDDLTSQGYLVGTYQAHPSTLDSEIRVAEDENMDLYLALQRRGAKMIDGLGGELLMEPCDATLATSSSTGNQSLEYSTQQDVNPSLGILSQSFFPHAYGSSGYSPKPVASTSQPLALPPTLLNSNHPMSSQFPDRTRHLCKLCPKSYTTHGSVLRHIKKEHPETNARS